ncbi:MAG TPA: site-2 protease family protein [Solirubrobacteraceae bacterium]|nr:site-2 protease family protein [Solirubrobacteraceae bacterium]
MTWVIAIAGFCALIVTHEAGHFLAAKAVGMRVERFSLFFPPKLIGFRRGETEYQIGMIPLGGYVKITGMTPDELTSVDLRVAERSYYMKAPWKRIVVILAGPAVNLITAFILFAVVLMAGNLDGEIAIGNLAPSQNTVNVISNTKVGTIVRGSGASGHLRLKDRILAVDGHPATPTGLAKLVDAHQCAGAPTSGCAATRPARVTVVRGGKTLTVSVTPHYSRADKRMLLGVQLGGKYLPIHFGFLSALGTSVTAMWDTGTSTITHYFDALVSSKARRQLQSAVGIAQDTQQAVARGAGLALVVLALVSLVLAVVNLFPFLPLDGGHVVWSLGEKLRGRRISIATMWRFSSVGIVLLGFLVISGISNDVSRLSG